MKIFNHFHSSKTQTKNNVKEAISEKIKRFALKNRSHIFNYNTHTQYNVIFVKRKILAPDVSHQTEIVNSSRLGVFSHMIRKSVNNRKLLYAQIPSQNDEKNRSKTAEQSKISQ